MGHNELIGLLRRPLEATDTARLRRALIEHNVCSPPPCPAGCTTQAWFNTWPDDCLAAALDFCRSAGVL